MTDTERKAAAKKFAEYWAGRGYEKGESQTFWNMLLRDRRTASDSTDIHQIATAIYSIVIFVSMRSHSEIKALN